MSTRSFGSRSNSLLRAVCSRRPLLLLVILLPLLVSPGPASCRREGPAWGALSPAEFAGIIHTFSEKDGFFWSNNYISNETSYLHPLGALDQLGVRHGVYIGVGPDQNFTYIASIEPRLAFIVDIRRDNLLEHLLFKILTQEAESRLDYLSLLTGRPVLGPHPPVHAGIEEIVARIDTASPDEGFFRRTFRRVSDTLRNWPELGLTAVDLHDIERIYYEFFLQGLDIKYDSWRSFYFPTLRELLLQTDLENRHLNWLASHETYRVVREMQIANRIIPVVGDFAGDRAFRELGGFVRGHGETVSALYVSNVEFYLFRQGRWERFVENVRRLPIDDRSVFIRAYANFHRPHPLMVRNHITVTLVQNVKRFVENADRGLYRDLWDVVTTDYLHER